MILKRVIWSEPDSDDDVADHLEQSCQVTGFLRAYIESGKTNTHQLYVDVVELYTVDVVVACPIC